MASGRDLKFAILRYLRMNGRRNKWNTLGNPGQPGDLELFLQTRFDHEARARADFAWDVLRREDFIRSDYHSTSGPAEWAELTDKGQRALERHTLDELDLVLAEAGHGLVDMRDQAWQEMDATNWSAWRQAAAGFAELVDLLLHSLAPDESVRAQHWYEPVTDSRTGVSRRQRARLVMEQRHGRADMDRCAALVAAQDELQGLKHARRAYEREVVLAAIISGEAALRHVVIWSTRAEATGDKAKGGTGDPVE